MSLGVDSLGLNDEKSSFSFINWALETGVWDGRPVSWSKALDFKVQVEKKIAALLISQDPASSDFHVLATQLASLGTCSENRQVLIEDIQALGISPRGMFVQAGFGKSLSKFWKKHKVEIIVGVAAAAAITAVAVATLCSGGAAAGVAAAGGSAALDALKVTKKDPTSQDPLVKGDVPNDIAMPSWESVAPKFEDMPPELLPYIKDGILQNNQFLAYNDILQMRLSDDFGGFATIRKVDEPVFGSDFRQIPAPQLEKEKRWFSWALETIGHEVAFGEFGEVVSKPPLPHREPSQVFRTEGIQPRHLQIGGINGIATMLEGAASHAEYLRKFTPNLSVEWVYNHSNTPLVDVAEVFLVNFPGNSPNTEELLLKNWTAFHEANKDNPNAKYLQFLHSQGAIHGENALVKAPEEIRQRVIVVAIAPAAIIPRRLCYRAYNYASKKDVVPYAEEIYVRALGLDGEAGEFQLQEVIKRREHLILLDPHPDVSASDPDHGFQSPTFNPVIDAHIKKYLKKNGVFQ